MCKRGKIEAKGISLDVENGVKCAIYTHGNESFAGVVSNDKSVTQSVTFREVKV